MSQFAGNWIWGLQLQDNATRQLGLAIDTVGGFVARAQAKVNEMTDSIQTWVNKISYVPKSTFDTVTKLSSLTASFTKASTSSLANLSEVIRSNLANATHLLHLAPHDIAELMKPEMERVFAGLKSGIILDIETGKANDQVAELFATLQAQGTLLEDWFQKFFGEVFSSLSEKALEDLFRSVGKHFKQGSKDVEDFAQQTTRWLSMVAQQSNMFAGKPNKEFNSAVNRIFTGLQNIGSVDVRGKLDKKSFEDAGTRAGSAITEKITSQYSKLSHILGLGIGSTLVLALFGPLRGLIQDFGSLISNEVTRALRPVFLALSEVFEAIRGEISGTMSDTAKFLVVFADMIKRMLFGLGEVYKLFVQWKGLITLTAVYMLAEFASVTRLLIGLVGVVLMLAERHKGWAYLILGVVTAFMVLRTAALAINGIMILFNFLTEVSTALTNRQTAAIITQTLALGGLNKAKLEGLALDSIGQKGTVGGLFKGTGSMVKKVFVGLGGLIGFESLKEFFKHFTSFAGVARLASSTLSKLSGMWGKVTEGIWLGVRLIGSMIMGVVKILGFLWSILTWPVALGIIIVGLFAFLYWKFEGVRKVVHSVFSFIWDLIKIVGMVIWAFLEKFFVIGGWIKRYLLDPTFTFLGKIWEWIKQKTGLIDAETNMVKASRAGIGVSQPVLGSYQQKYYGIKEPIALNLPILPTNNAIVSGIPVIIPATPGIANLSPARPAGQQHQIQAANSLAALNANQVKGTAAVVTSLDRINKTLKTTLTERDSIQFDFDKDHLVLADSR